MKFSSAIAALFTITLFLFFVTTIVQALPATTISQENDESGAWVNHVSGLGVSGNSYSESSTTVTSSDGRSIRH